MEQFFSYKWDSFGVSSYGKLIVALLGHTFFTEEIKISLSVARCLYVGSVMAGVRKCYS